MRTWVLWCIAAVAAGCAPAEEQPMQDQPAMETGSAATVSLADLAGTWTVTTMAETSDSVIITYELHATATQEGWTSTLPDREPTPVRVVRVDGDSVVAEAGPFESALRPGQMVTTQSVVRLQGGMLMGTMIARYATEAADSVMRARLHGMRKAP